MRCYLKSKTYTQSLRATNKQAAISLAKQFFHIKTAELYADKIEARPDKKVKFADLVPAVVVTLQARVKRGEFAAANIPIFLNADHHYSVERVKKAIDAGFDAAIFDGAALPLEENIAKAKENFWIWHTKFEVSNTI